VTTKPFGMIELAVKELLMTKLELPESRVIGDFSYKAGQDYKVWFGLVPGGSTDQIQGEWILDIDIFDDDYTDAMNAALALDAKIIGPKHRTSVMNLDNCYQNDGPVERPWNDDTVFRIGATYVFTARRSG